MSDQNRLSLKAEEKIYRRINQVDGNKFRALSPRQRALVAVAVLMDGRESALYFKNDSVNSTGLERAAVELAGLDPEMRMPYVGTQLRIALEELE